MYIVIDIILFLIGSISILLNWATLRFRMFDKRGVPYEKPAAILMDSVTGLYKRYSPLKAHIDFYRRNCKYKIHGMFSLLEPMYIINDPQSIKKITVKDFDHFPNHHPFFDTKDEPLIDGMLSIMKDQRWKDMRNTLTPVFTASKMRAMFPLMTECFAESMKHLHDRIQHNDGEIELKEHFARLSNDIIASTAFGLKVNSYKDQNNQFYNIGRSLAQISISQMFKSLLLMIMPRLMSKMGIKLFNTGYFKSIVVDTMKYREEHQIVRHDMIQLLMEAKKESGDKWSDEDLVAQCFIFFFAAFENNANLICTTCHELMENPDIQERLYEECLEIKNDLKGASLSYDIISKMKYMDMVVSESLRKWSLAFFTDRVCTKDYILTDDNDNVIFKFKKGDRIWIPIIGLHWDERYFERPEIFDPERFSAENKDKIVPFTYLPFGVGPRNCIGNRYALMQAKAMLYHILLDFKLERSPKTVKSLMDDIRSFQLSPLSGYWMRFVSRN